MGTADGQFLVWDDCTGYAVRWSKLQGRHCGRVVWGDAALILTMWVLILMLWECGGGMAAKWG